MNRTFMIVTAIAIIILIGGTGCMFTNEKKKEEKILAYLQEKYGETFEIETFREGSPLLPHLQVEGKTMVHPTHNKEIPFYVFTDSREYEDNYVLSHLSYMLTEEHKKKIEGLDEREKEVKLSYGCSNPPKDLEILQTHVDVFEKDPSYKCSIGLIVAIKANSKQETNNDSQFLYQLYEYMKKNTDRNFDIYVGYINESAFEDAKELVKIAHTVNYSWTIFEDAVISSQYFERNDDISDPSYFDKFNE